MRHGHGMERFAIALSSASLLAGCMNGTADLGGAAGLAPRGTELHDPDQAAPGLTQGPAQPAQGSAGASTGASTPGRFTCGARTVTHVPVHQYVSADTTDYLLSVDRPESPLAQVLAPYIACSEGRITSNEGASMARDLLRVGADGEIMARYSLSQAFGRKIASFLTVENERFVVEDGCLHLQRDHASQPFDSDAFLPADTDTPDSTCGPGRLALYRGGLFGARDADDEPVCVRFEVQKSCRDCGFENGEWVESIEMRYAFVSEGTLEGIDPARITGRCDESEGPLSIHVGDRITFTLKYTQRYRLSSSPQELGYEEIQTGLPQGFHNPFDAD